MAIARKLAVVIHAMWTDGTCYEGEAESVPADPAGKLYHCGPRHNHEPYDTVCQIKS